ncbi:hypothetical protein ACH5RR_015338 [Cinchona calisaya]|uniref:Uncharacterized protein n=1 Tax=Cinchona calisaya TaxID=153742 RepID=A0ABD2ZSW7_9GENT
METREVHCNASRSKGPIDLLQMVRKIAAHNQRNCLHKLKENNELGCEASGRKIRIDLEKEMDFTFSEEVYNQIACRSYVNEDILDPSFDYLSLRSKMDEYMLAREMQNVWRQSNNVTPACQDRMDHYTESNFTGS